MQRLDTTYRIVDRTSLDDARRWLRYGALVAGLALALVLHVAEAALPIHPTWIWVEVAIGTALALGLARAARRRVALPLAAHVYERMVWAAFVWSGLPVIGWQLLIYVALPALRGGAA
jgi:hypothetical protein